MVKEIKILLKKEALKYVPILKNVAVISIVGKKEKKYDGVWEFFRERNGYAAADFGDYCHV